MAQDLKIFKMGLLGIPQERIAQRLGIPEITERFVQTHLPRFSELKNGVNDLLKRGFGVNTIAEKLGWPQQEIADHPDVTVKTHQAVSKIAKNVDTDKICNLFYQGKPHIFQKYDTVVILFRSPWGLNSISGAGPRCRLLGRWD